MAGTKAGGLKAAEKNREKDPDFYKKIGSKGGSKTGIKKGFALMTDERRKEVSAQGGIKSRRKK